jgi:hypothetical protein
MRECRYHECIYRRSKRTDVRNEDLGIVTYLSVSHVDGRPQ